MYLHLVSPLNLWTALIESISVVIFQHHPVYRKVASYAANRRGIDYHKAWSRHCRLAAMDSMTGLLYISDNEDILSGKPAWYNYMELFSQIIDTSDGLYPPNNAPDTFCATPAAIQLCG